VRVRDGVGGEPDRTGAPREGWRVETVATRDGLDEERAALFALLGRLLWEPPDAALLARLRSLDGSETPLGRALAGLAAAAEAADPAALEREHFNLFIGVGRGELMPYGSWYLTGFLHDRPLAELRGTLRRLGIERAPGVPEPEDHIAFECETFAGLIANHYRGAGPEAACEFFAVHLRPWAARFFADLEKAEAARFYRAVGTLGRVAVEIEGAAADLPA
jgi:TorA maturation chaperone TorD